VTVKLFILPLRRHLGRFNTYEPPACGELVMRTSPSLSAFP
jgi:hypothetical protein